MNQWPQTLKRRSRLVVGTLGVVAGWAIALNPLLATAVQLGDGSTMFTSPPRLDSFTTTENIASRKFVTYYVTVNLLPEAGEPLETLRVSLIEGRFTRLAYRTDDIEVFSGSRGDRQKDYPLQSVDYDEAAQALTIRLAEAAPPGEQLTFALKLVRNPTQEGVYLFEVTAAPAGDNPVFQRVGTGRINIYAADRDPFFHLR